MLTKLFSPQLPVRKRPHRTTRARSRQGVVEVAVVEARRRKAAKAAEFGEVVDKGEVGAVAVKRKMGDDVEAKEEAVDVKAEVKEREAAVSVTSIMKG